MTTGELIADCRRFVAKYPKRNGEKPLTLLADIGDLYRPVLLSSVSADGVVFVESTAGTEVNVETVIKALESAPSGAQVYLLKRPLAAVAMHNKQAVVLLPQSS